MDFFNWAGLLEGQSGISMAAPSEEEVERHVYVAFWDMGLLHKLHLWCLMSKIYATVHWTL